MLTCLSIIPILKQAFDNRRGQIRLNRDIVDRGRQRLKRHNLIASSTRTRQHNRALPHHRAHRCHKYAPGRLSEPLIFNVVIGYGRYYLRPGKSCARPPATNSTAMAARISPIRRVTLLSPVCPSFRLMTMESRSISQVMTATTIMQRIR